MVTLKGEGFLLRPLRETDAESLRRSINNRRIARWTLRIPYPYTLRDAHEWTRNRARKRSDLQLAIDIGGEVVGGIGIEHVEGHKGELGYWLAEQEWGKGIMTRAVRLVVRHAFGTLGLRRVYAYVFPRNRASACVLEKNGFVLEGRLRKNVRKEGKLTDELLYAKVR